MSAPQVDLVVNCWERSYREVLAPGFILALADESRFPFAGRVVLINNVDDLGDARARAARLLGAGEITAVHVVAERLDGALAATGLTRADLGAAPHFTNCSLVAVTAPGAPWLVYWDADVRLREPVDWVSPSIALMEREPRVLVANPNNAVHPEPGPGTVEVRDGFALGYGFSDQLYLARRAELGSPMYGDRHLARLRYPMAHVARIFEARVDSHMRRHGRLRASHLGSAYVHPVEAAGASHAAGGTARQRLVGTGQRAVLAALRATPRRLRPRTLRDL